ncbi:MAG TPA: hybrid sensor histidine kinase/response regulator [Steroidobacteraceae bacterium]|nr:hybrid sensor histidine kinase/response regulator [Steroidobacteraceae bacterium]
MPAAPAEHALLIAAEKIRIQYRNMPMAFTGCSIVCCMMSIALLRGAGAGPVITWTLSVHAWVLARFFQWRAFNRANPGPHEMRRWGTLAVAGSAAAGLIWGVGAMVMYVPDGLAYQLFLVMGLVGMGAGCVYASASSQASFFAYFYPSILLPAVLFLSERDPLHISTGVLMLAYVALLTPLALRLYRFIDQSIRLRVENLGLIGELRAQKEAAEVANVAKTRFLAAASHDLRQPLHALGLFVQALQETPLASRERQVIGNIRRSVDEMEELFNSLLDISRLDAGVVQPQFSTVSLSVIFDRVRFECAQIARQKRLSLKVVRTSLCVRSDPSLLVRLLRNLLSNAVRYTDSGRVVLGCRRQGNDVRVEVWDTGRGIPADRHEDIFREFYQLDNAEGDRGRGLGLGLAIVDRLARLLNFRVNVRSVVGRGSVFSFTLPRAVREADGMEECSPEATAFDLSQALVLVVDDEPAVQEAMAALLRRWECEVLTAGSGAEMKGKLIALKRLPSLIVSDYRLRGAENGIQVIEMLRGEFNTDIPALLVTGDTGLERLRDAEASGLPILHKPVHPARLRTLIANLLREHGQPPRGEHGQPPRDLGPVQPGSHAAVP